MKIEFEDGSYLEIIPKDNSAVLVLCGTKNKREFTMSSVNLTAEQIQKVLSFLRQLEVLV